MRFLRQFSDNVTLVGGGTVTAPMLDLCLSLAPQLVAVDAGADQALALGHVPQAVTGDMDSVSAQARSTIGPDRFYHTPDQDFTDFHKALKLIKAPLILAAGFTGKRLDHELACYNTLVRLPEKQVIIVGETDICTHLNAPLHLHLPVGTRVSLFAMAPLNARATGLVWPVENLPLSPWGRTGTSNASSAPEITVEADGDGLLVILPRRHLGALITGLS